MIVPDFSPLTGSHPAGLYQGLMMKMMGEGRSFTPYLARSPPTTLSYPAPIRRSPPGQICSPPGLIDYSRSSGRPGYHHGIPLRLTAPLSQRSETAVSPVSSEGGVEQVFPSGSASDHMFASSGASDQIIASSEDGDGDRDGDGLTDEEKKAFKCPQCLYFTDRKNNLKRHIVTMHQECTKTLDCCGVVFHSKAALRDHVGLFHRGGYRCQICSRNFCRKALLRRHLTVHSGRKDFSCNLCGYATSHKSNLERHQKVHLRRNVSPTTQNIQLMEPCGSDRKSYRDPTKKLLHREKTINRFILLPNRLKYTHSAVDSQNRLQPDNVLDVKLDSENRENGNLATVNEDQLLQSNNTRDKKDVCISSDSSVLKHPPKLGNSHQTRLGKFKSPRRRLLVSSRRRMCGTPYKCCDCGQSFSKQGEFHEHSCDTLRQSHNIGLSVITAVRKGKIQLTPRTDSCFQNTLPESKCSEENVIVV